MALITSTITYYRSTYYTVDVEVTPPDPLTATMALFTVKAEKFEGIVEQQMFYGCVTPQKNPVY